MKHCTECGAKVNNDAKFCGECGAKRQPQDSSSKTIIKKSHGFGFWFSILILLIIFYFVLNIWAISQLQIDTSLDSVISSISNFDFQTGLTSSSVSTSIRVKNPTIIPVITTSVSYDIKYGDTELGRGSTGSMLIMSYSSTETSANFRLSHINTGKAAIEVIIDSLKQETKTPRITMYAELGPIKIPVRSI